MRVSGFFILAMGLMLPLANAEPHKDIAGWSDTQWGMSPADLTELHPDFSIGTNKYGSTAGRLPDVTIAGAQFQIYFEFEGVGGLAKVGSSDSEPPREQWKLVRVELHGPEDSCYRVTETLLGKYGQPTKREGEFYLWVLPSTTVRKVQRTDCKIIYHPTEATDNL